MRRRPLSSVYGLRLLFEPRAQWAALAAVLAILLVFRANQLVGYSSQSVWGHDFSAYWLAGRHVLAGEPIYAPFQLSGPVAEGVQFEYLYPPFFAVVIAPFASLFEDYRTANWAWAAIGSVIVALVVMGVARRERLADGRRRLFLVGAAFGFAPVLGELIIGGVQLPILGLLAGSWLALRNRTPRGEFAAGALVGIAALIKVFPGLLILWFVLTGRIRAAAAAVAAMAVLAAATIPVVGLQAWLDYPSVLLHLGTLVDVRDLLSLSVWLSALMPLAIARLVVLAAGLAVLVWIARRGPEAVSFAVAVAISILITPSLFQHYLAVLVLPLLLAMRYAPPLGWVAVAYLLMSGGEQEALGDLVWIVNRVLPTLGALLVVAGLIWFGRRRLEPEPSGAGASP